MRIIDMTHASDDLLGASAVLTTIWRTERFWLGALAAAARGVA